MTAEDNGNKPAVYTDDEGRTIYRGSALGMCRTMLIIVRSGFEPMAPPDAMQRRFDEGHLHEADMVRRLNTEHGVEVFNREREVDLWITPTLAIRGHIDGETTGWLEAERHEHLMQGIDPGPGPHRLLENKTMSSLAYKEWCALDWPARWKKYPGYAMQITAYGEATGHSEVVYCVKDKESGQMFVEATSTNAYPLPLIKSKVLGIEAHVRQGLPLPDDCDVRSWPCPVFYMGPCGEEQRDTLDERIDEVVQALAVTYDEQRAVEARAKKAKELARDEIKKHLGKSGKFDTAAGWKVSMSKVKTETVDAFDEERFKAEHPDLHEQYLTEKTKRSGGALNVTAPKTKES